MTPNNGNDDRNSDIEDLEIPEDLELPDDIAALLGQEATWEPVEVDFQESIVAAVLAEAAVAESTSHGNAVESVNPEPTNVQPAADAGTSNVVAMRSRWNSAALGAAAALLVVAGIFGASRIAASGPDVELALAGTELAVDASATAELTELDEGTRIVLTLSNLPPAAAGTYYEAWLRKDADVGVSAGTFHLRKGEGPIELWAGVLIDDYPLLTVTLQQEAQTESSGQVVLKARVGG